MIGSRFAPSSPPVPSLPAAAPATRNPLLQVIADLRTPGCWNSQAGDIVPWLVVQAASSRQPARGVADTARPAGMHDGAATPAALSSPFLLVIESGRGVRTEFGDPHARVVTLRLRRDHYTPVVDGVERSVPRDGDCFYHALLAALHGRTGLARDEDIVRLRNGLADYVAAHPAEVGQWLVSTSQGSTVSPISRTAAVRRASAAPIDSAVGLDLSLPRRHQPARQAMSGAARAAGVGAAPDARSIEAGAAAAAGSELEADVDAAVDAIQVLPWWHSLSARLQRVEADFRAVSQTATTHDLLRAIRLALSLKEPQVDQPRSDASLATEQLDSHVSEALQGVFLILASDTGQALLREVFDESALPPLHAVAPTVGAVREALRCISNALLSELHPAPGRAALLQTCMEGLNPVTIERPILVDLLFALAPLPANHPEVQRFETRLAALPDWRNQLFCLLSQSPDPGCAPGHPREADYHLLTAPMLDEAQVETFISILMQPPAQRMPTFALAGLPALETRSDRALLFMLFANQGYAALNLLAPEIFPLETRLCSTEARGVLTLPDAATSHATRSVASWRLLLNLLRQTRGDLLDRCGVIDWHSPERGFQGRTPLLYAALFANESNLVVALLRDAEAHDQTDRMLAQRNYDGATVLHAAARSCPDMIADLIALGAETEARDAAGHTPLQWAVTAGHTASVRILLDLGVDPSVLLESRAGMAQLTAIRETEPLASRITRRLLPRSLPHQSAQEGQPTPAAHQAVAPVLSNRLANVVPRDFSATGRSARSMPISVPAVLPVSPDGAAARMINELGDLILRGRLALQAGRRACMHAVMVGRSVHYEVGTALLQRRVPSWNPAMQAAATLLQTGQAWLASDAAQNLLETRLGAAQAQTWQRDLSVVPLHPHAALSRLERLFAQLRTLDPQALMALPEEMLGRVLESLNMREAINLYTAFDELDYDRARLARAFDRVLRNTQASTLLRREVLDIGYDARQDAYAVSEEGLGLRLRASRWIYGVNALRHIQAELAPPAAAAEGETDSETAGNAAATDAGEEAGTEAGAEAGIEAGIAADIEAGIEAGIDAGIEGRIEAGTEARTDATMPADGATLALGAGDDQFQRLLFLRYGARWDAPRRFWSDAYDDYFARHGSANGFEISHAAPSASLSRRLARLWYAAPDGLSRYTIPVIAGAPQQLYEFGGRSQTVETLSLLQAALFSNWANLAVALVDEACRRGDDLEALLAMRSSNGDTALHTAARHALDAVPRLLQCGASLTARNLAGATPLGMALANRNVAAVHALLAAPVMPESRLLGQLLIEHAERALAADAALVYALARAGSTVLLLVTGAQQRYVSPGSSTSHILTREVAAAYFAGVRDRDPLGRRLTMAQQQLALWFPQSLRDAWAAQRASAGDASVEHAPGFALSADVRNFYAPKIQRQIDKVNRVLELSDVRPASRSKPMPQWLQRLREHVVAHQADSAVDLAPAGASPRLAEPGQRAPLPPQFAHIEMIVEDWANQQSIAPLRAALRALRDYVDATPPSRRASNILKAVDRLERGLGAAYDKIEALERSRDRLLPSAAPVDPAPTDLRYHAMMNLTRQNDEARRRAQRHASDLALDMTLSAMTAMAVSSGPATAKKRRSTQAWEQSKVENRQRDAQARESVRAAHRASLISLPGLVAVYAASRDEVRETQAAMHSVALSASTASLAGSSVAASVAALDTSSAGPSSAETSTAIGAVATSAASTTGATPTPVNPAVPRTLPGAPPPFARSQSMPVLNAGAQAADASIPPWIAQASQTSLASSASLALTQARPVSEPPRPDVLHNASHTGSQESLSSASGLAAHPLPRLTMSPPLASTPDYVLSYSSVGAGGQASRADRGGYAAGGAGRMAGMPGQGSRAVGSASASAAAASVSFPSAVAPGRGSAGDRALVDAFSGVGDRVGGMPSQASPRTVVRRLYGTSRNAEATLLESSRRVIQSAQAEQQRHEAQAANQRMMAAERAQAQTRRRHEPSLR